MHAELVYFEPTPKEIVLTIPVSEWDTIQYDVWRAGNHAIERDGSRSAYDVWAAIERAWAGATGNYARGDLDNPEPDHAPALHW